MQRLRVSLLGGFQARLEPDGPLSFRTRKAEALLAYLALRAGHAHRRESLAAFLWGDLRDEQARGSLRHALYELRKALAPAPGALRTQGDRVTIDPALIDLDVTELTRLLDAGTPAALAQAAALYRGDLLASLTVREEPWEAWVRDERERLRERALHGLARLLDHHRKVGALEAAIATARQLLELEPLEESVHRTLMRLHGQVGQRGAALRQYQHCVAVLRRELSVEPEAETRQLCQEIVQQRGASILTAPAKPARKIRPPEVRAAETPLVGRATEMAQLRAALDRAASGRGGLCAVVGEAGIGKTRLVEELIADAARRNVRVLAGRAHEGDEILLFGPVVDALRTGEVAHDTELLEALGPIWRAELSRLLPDVGGGEGHPSTRVDYRRLFEAIARLGASLAARAPLLVVLEDLHWADELTVRLLAFLARGVVAERILVVVTAREESLPDAPILRHRLEDLAQSGHLTSLFLGPLSRPDTDALVEALSPPGAVTAGLGERVWNASEGNPLVTVEIVREIQERGRDEILILPRRVREVISRRFERLDEESRSLLSVAAVIGREFDFDLLRHAAGLEDEVAARGLEKLVRRRLLTGVGERLGFTHERLRDVAYAELPAWRRAELHRRVGEALERLRGGRQSELGEALAEHYERGGAWARAFDYHLRVAERARQHYAYATAERACRRAVDVAAKAPTAALDVARALELHGDIASLMGDLDGANDRYDAALVAGTTEGDRSRIASKVHRPRVARRDGATLAYYEHGRGDETLLVTNPLIYGLELLQPLLEALCQEFRIITMDLRGTGRSDPIPARYSIADHAADIGAVIEAAGRGPVTAIGISKSGNMLVRLAVAAPSLVKRLVLLGTPLDVTPGSPSLVPGPVDDRFRAALRAGDLQQAMRHFVATIVTEPDTGELTDQLTRNILKLPRESILSNWVPDPEVDIAPILGQVKAPTLVLHGMEDRRVAVAAARHLADHIPDARLHLFEGRGHLPIFTATGEFCDVLRRFVADDFST